jgi:iron complex transport system ATP-binding protein
MLLIKDLKVSMGQRVLLSGFDCRVNSGKLIVLMGANGIGKTTVIKSLAKLHPCSGKVYVNNIDLARASSRERAQLVSIYLTKWPQLDYVKVEDILSFARAPYTNFWNTLTSQDLSVIDSVLKKLKLSDFKGRQFIYLSDGEKARVLIARALVQDTSMILLDEPLAYLDFLVRPLVVSVLREVAKEKVVIFASHDSSVMKLVDQVWLMNDCKIVVDAPDRFIGHLDK